MKKHLVLALALAAAFASGAVEWRNIDEGSWIGGAKISSPDKLAGRVVLVDVWGVNCPPCRALLPRIEEIWEKFGLPAGKPCVVIGSHRQERDDEALNELIKRNKLKYPIYQGAGIASGEPSSGGTIPFMYVLNHRGKVVYQGRSDREALEAVVNALGEIGNPSLTGDVVPVKYKMFARTLALGKPIANVVKKLEYDVKTSRDSAAVEEAQALLAAIKQTKSDIIEDIACLKERDPVEAVRMITLFKKTWPKDFDALYKAGMPELVAKAKAKKAEKKNGE